MEDGFDAKGDVVTWTLSGLFRRGGGVGTGGRGDDEDAVPCSDLDRMGLPAEFTSGESGRKCRDDDAAEADAEDAELLCTTSSTSSMDNLDGEISAFFDGDIDRTVDLINGAGGPARAFATYSMDDADDGALVTLVLSAFEKSVPEDSEDL